MRRAIRLPVAGAGAMFLVLTISAPASSRVSTPTDPGTRLQQAMAAANRPGPDATRLDNFRLVGHHDLAGLGQDIRDYADVWGHRNTAYVGSRCGERAAGGAGVRVVDIFSPSHPKLVSVLPNPRFSRAEDVVVRHVETPHFTGELAAVGIQQCFEPAKETAYTGLAFFDVTSPAHPRTLSVWKLPPRSIGCHEIDLVQRPGGRVLAGCARNLVDQINGSPGVHFVDVSNPREPRTVSTFALDVNVLSGVGCAPLKFDHSVRFVHSGTQAYLSYWDAGTVLLDLRDAKAPRLVSRTRITPPDEDGDNHSMTLANGGKWLIINPEDFSPFDRRCRKYDGYGEAYVYDNTNPSHPRFVGSFATPNTHSSRTDGAFTVHNTEVVNGRQFFSSWYSDGVVWWTMSDSGAARQLGQFVPRTVFSEGDAVWGVYPDPGNDVILASSFSGGLWILKPVGLGDF